MSVRWKLFLAMASLIAGLGAVFVLMTQLLVWGILHGVMSVDRAEELGALENELLASYRENGGSWTNVRAPAPPAGASYALFEPNGELLLQSDDTSARLIRRLGLAHRLEANGENVGSLHYYDEEIASRAVTRHGISSAVTTFTIVGAVFFVLLALGVALLWSRRLTAPLRALLPAIERVGAGELGVQAPADARDEYGAVARAFNAMSARLRRTEEARRNLVADVAHELRTPITIVRGKLDLAQQEGKPLEPEQLLPLQDELIRLTRLVDDLHQLSLAEAKRLPLELRPTVVPELLQRIVDKLAPDAEAKRLTLTLAVGGADDGGDAATRDGSAHDGEGGSTAVDAAAYNDRNAAARGRTSPDAVVLADPVRLTQTFLNLLTNAIRYTPEGGAVRIAVRADEQAGALTVRIADTGIGIAPDQLPLLFDRFYRTDEARSRHDGGMGLGLAIAKELVELHGGTIGAESVVGEGTAFVVTLPLYREPSPPLR